MNKTILNKGEPATLPPKGKQNLRELCTILILAPTIVLTATAASILPGETKTGSIVSPGQLNAYSFSANAGDTVSILIGKSSGFLNPEVELHAPDGTMIATGWGDSMAYIWTRKLAQAGTYLIVCLDHWGTGTGEYAVSLIKNPGPNLGDPDGGPLQPGETKTGSITVADLDVFSFTANAGDTVSILMGKSSGFLNPEVELHAPDGTMIAWAWGDSAATIRTNVSQAGTYLIVCLDHWGTGTGGYGVSFLAFTNAPPPSVVIQPSSITTNVGATVIFNVIASGTPPLTYQWFFNGVPISGTTTTNFTLTNVSTNQSGTYAVVVSNVAGSATASARLTVLIPPHIVVQPQPPSVVTNVGANVTFTVAATGDHPLNYQWFFKALGQATAAPLTGRTNTSLTLTNVTPADSGDYLVFVSNPVGIEASHPASLIVQPPNGAPTITAQPQSQTTTNGASATFSVTASGSQPLGYQWQFNGTNIAGAVKPSLTLDNIVNYDTNNQTGTYTVQVTNADGNVASVPASLTLFHPADINPSDNDLTMAEVVAYAAAWKLGATWPVNPNPIPMDYMVRGGALWKGGEKYYDDTSVPPPACWKNQPHATLQSRSTVRAVTSETSNAVVRSFAAQCTSAAPIVVTVKVTPGYSVCAYAIEDQPPAKWVVSNVNEGGAFDAINGKVKWGLFTDSRARILTYEVQPPNQATGGGTFTGAANFDGLVEVPIGGQRQIVVNQPRLSAQQLTLQPDRSLQLRLDVPVGMRVVVEASADLLHWETVSDRISDTTTINVKDVTATTAPSRFYRLKYLPQ